MTARRVAGGLALAALVALYAVCAVRLANRGALDGDEAEFLQGGTRVARGERIYTDFFEHHTPFLIQVLARLDGGGAGAYIRRARVLSAAFGAIALAAAVLLTWRATRRLYAPAIVIGGMMAEPLIAARAFADVRPEPFALAFFLLGAALIALASRRVAAGALGVGLLAISFAINPKWPLSTLAIAATFVIGERPLRRVGLAAVAVAAALLLLFTWTDPRAYVDFVFFYNRELFRWSSAHSGALKLFAISPFFYCPAVLLPRFIFPAAALVAAAAARLRGAFADVRLVWGTLLLLIASAIELRFVHAYPVLWPQYFIVYALAASATYAFLPQAVVALVPERVRPVAGATAAVFAAIAVVQGILCLPMPNVDPMAVSRARLAAMLGPADTVFMGSLWKPIGAREASYYWFGFTDVVPVSIEFARTPRGRTMLPPIAVEDLPPCRLERGLEPHLRLLGGDPLGELPAAAACFHRLVERGIVVRTHAPAVYRVRRPGELQ